MQNLLILALALLVIPYVLGPVTVLSRRWFPDRYRLRKAHFVMFLEKQPPDFRRLHDDIIRLGFVHAGASELTHGDVTTYFSIYIDELRGLLCTIYAIVSRKALLTQLEFTRAYENGAVVNVNNSPIIDVYPPSWRKKTYRFPKINDLELLLDVANKIFSRLDCGRNPISISRQDAFEFVESHLNQELDSLVERGWVSKETRNNGRRATVKGAILMAWKMCWPIKGFRNWLDIIAAKRALHIA